MRLPHTLKSKASLDHGALFLFASYLLGLILMFRPFVHGEDPVGYYSWLPAAIVEHKLDVADAFVRLADNFDPQNRAFYLSQKTPTGYQHNQWAPGSALLWAPFYGVTHAAILLADALGASIPADGYFWPYPFAASLASTLFALAAILLTYRLARHYFGAFLAVLATGAVWFATPLVFYMFAHPLMSHADDAFMCTLIIYLWWRGQAQSGWLNGLWLGLTIGLATWVRNQNAAFLAAPLALAAWDALEIVRRRAPLSLQLVVGRSVALLAGFGLAFVPLMLFWRQVYGAWILNTYAASQGPHTLDWTAPHMIDVFFSSNRGMFIWTPITLLALVGLWWLRKTDGRLTAFVTFLFVAQLYVVSSWFAWSGAAAFGPRYWSNMLAMFTLGLAALLNQLRRVPRWVLVAGGVAFAVWNLLLIVQYSLGTIPRGGPVNVAEMVKNQFIIVPNNLARLAQAFLKRR